MPTKEAMDIAQEKGLDLVEVAPNAKPPVCRLMDYGKYIYQQQKRNQEAKKKQTQVQLKEVKFRPKTDQHDFETKIRHIHRFLEQGNRCKISIFFRGREIVHKEQGEELIQRIQEALASVAKIEQEPKFEGRAINMIVAPLPKK
jgi:translation initiation factor IF-3